MIRKSKFYTVVILAFVCSIFLFNSCVSEFVVPIEVDIVIPEEGLSFENDIIPVFDNSCNFSGCHVVNHFIVDLTPANAYNDIIAKGMVDIANPEQSKLYAKLVASGSTHANRSTPTEQQLILEWIRDGAKNN